MLSARRRRLGLQVHRRLIQHRTGTRLRVLQAPRPHGDPVRGLLHGALAANSIHGYGPFAESARLQCGRSALRLLDRSSRLFQRIGEDDVDAFFRKLNAQAHDDGDPGRVFSRSTRPPSPPASGTSPKPNVTATRTATGSGRSTCYSWRIRRPGCPSFTVSARARPQASRRCAGRWPTRQG